ncbi:MAG: DUF4259 domain-containing protein [Planctomycetaceae bacterium]|nr:DUF4259 domain-containing protein [Planctomycetaceae bacterium]
MGAWGPGTFENDGALDWIGDLAEVKDGWSLIRSALKSAMTPGESDGQLVLAAAECVAVCRGKPPASPPPADLSGWCARHKSGYSEELRVLALKAVQHIRGDSELKDLWDESGPEEWNDAVADLERRLSS